MGKMVRNDIEYGVQDPETPKFWTTVAVTDITLDIELRWREIVVNLAAAAGTATLPSVKEADGLEFTVRTPTVGNALTLQDRNDSIDWQGDFTLDAADDLITLKAVNGQWVVVENRIA